jgi:hypothetical protein
MKGNLSGEELTAPARRRIRLLFLVLLPCLLLQLKLRTYTEPYPGIFLPAGATLLHGDDSFTGYETECVAEDSGGKQYPFLAATILDAVPGNYRPLVVQAGFGINEERTVRHLQIPFIRRKLELGHAKTRVQIEATRVWLRTRLRKALGIDPVRVRVFTYAVTTYYGTGPPRQERHLERQSWVALVSATP